MDLLLIIKFKANSNLNILIEVALFLVTKGYILYLDLEPPTP